ncbi:NnrS family protein [Herminiimonas sp. NPDC097707]|uniref:NnrS family protein n=1 Tax=Herminiimonas sp. NPDC097707 TaxID=3364007 RepID=UPI00383A8694
MTLLKIDEPEVSMPRHASFTEQPVWQLGFRPFYLLAALFAVLSIPLWIAQYFGVIHMPRVDLFWHMHEMVYGFAIAVVVGFLLTAMRAWTGLWTPRKGHLAALAGVWLAGRIAMLWAPPLWAAVMDLAFLPLAAWPMFRVLQRAGNKRNMFLIVMLGLLTLSNLLFHAAVNGLLTLSPMLVIQAAILLIVIIESLIGARVIPMFTANGAPGTKPIVHTRRDLIAVLLTAAASLTWIFGAPALTIAAFAFAAACALLLRLAGWQPQRTVRVPLLWILHLSYGWIPVGFFLLALAAVNLIPVSAAFHALTVGSMAGLILGMMTRTTLGHTGRLLKAGPAEVTMYLLIQAGALARVAAAFELFGWRDAVLVFSTLCWSAAFILYVAVYAPYLLRARIDGKEG